jgi:hypothetical protein
VIKKATRWISLGGFSFPFTFNLSDFYLHRSPNIKSSLHKKMEEPIDHDNNNSEGYV